MPTMERPTSVKCQDCDGFAIVRGYGNIPTRCDKCRLEHHRTRTRLRNRQRRGNLPRPLEKNCEDCNGLIVIPVGVGGVPRFCPSCRDVRRKTYLAKAYRRHNLKRNYGLTEEDRAELETKQAGKCAICQKIAALNVDHCHTSGDLRGLLCHKCNLALGGFGDNPDLLRRAVNYLEGKLDA